MKIARIATVGPVLLLASHCGCAKVGRPQAEFCERIARVLFTQASIATLESTAAASKAHGIVTHVTLNPAGGKSETHEVDCDFAGGPGSSDQLELIGVSTDVEEALNAVHMAMLNFVLEHERGMVAARLGGEPGPSQEAAASSPRVEALYFLQQLVNGSTLGCVVALIAVGYTLIYGIIGVINLSFGDIYMIGAVGSAITVWLFLLSGLDSYVPSVLLALPLIMALTAGLQLGDRAARLPSLAAIEQPHAAHRFDRTFDRPAELRLPGGRRAQLLAARACAGRRRSRGGRRLQPLCQSRAGCRAGADRAAGRRDLVSLGADALRTRAAGLLPGQADGRPPRRRRRFRHCRDLWRGRRPSCCGWSHCRELLRGGQLRDGPRHGPQGADGRDRRRDRQFTGKRSWEASWSRTWRPFGPPICPAPTARSPYSRCSS